MPTRPLTAASITEAGGDRGPAFYFLALECAQSLWLAGLPAQSLLLINRALSADLRGDEPVLQEWPPPYAAAVWIMRHHDPDHFIGNPRRHYQHLATRMVEPRKELRSWRAWGCWALARSLFPDLPADEKQLAEEGVIEPGHNEIDAHLARLGLPGEAAVWREVLERAGQPDVVGGRQPGSHGRAMTAVLEICVDCAASVEACQETRIPRIELCAGLVEGGTTPSLGFLRQSRAAYDGKIMMMIRPRAGDFVVSPAERRVMCDDIQAARDHGADGVVFGCLRPDGTIDEATAEALVAAAAGLDMTFHRAFDVSLDHARSLDQLIALGIPRVLTSGGQAGVEAGSDTLTALHDQAQGRIALLAGGGLKPGHIARLWRHGIREFHLSARTSVESPMIHRRPDIPMGAAEVPGEYVRRQADPVVLRSLLNLLGQQSS